MRATNGLTFLIKIGVIYLFLAILNLIFFLYNKSIIGIIELNEISDLLKGFLRFSTANICYTFGLYAAFVTFPFSYNFYCSRHYKNITFVLYTIGILSMTTINLCDAVYFHYAAKRFTANEIFFLEDNSNNTALLIQFLKDNVSLIIIGIVIITIWILIYLRLPIRHIKFRNKRFHYVCHSIAFLTIVFLIVVGMRGGLNRQTRPITISNAAQYSATPIKGAIILSNPFCILRTIENKPAPNIQYFDSIKLHTLFSTHKDSRTDSLIVKSQKGKNVIIFILESFSAEHSKKMYPDLYANTLTPFIDSLMSEGYILKKTYANGKKSIDALPSVLSSIPSLEVPFATLPEALSHTDAIGNIAVANGYSTWFFNGSERGSMGYAAYAKIAGVKNFRSKEDYELAHGTNDFDGYWGIWDEPFFKYMGETLNTEQKPFISIIFSLTSHHPFVVPEKYKKSLPKGYTKVHQPVAYVDLALKHFFDYAKKQAWYKNTLFVFVADHVSSEKYGQEAYTSTGSNHIMHFYYTPDGNIKGESNRTTQQLDIMPTLVSLLGFRCQYHSFGNNIFSNSSQPGYAINYTDGDYQWISQDTTYIFNGSEIIAAYDLRNDSLQTNNIASKIDTDIVTKIKAFIQTYHEEIKERNFTIK